MLKCKKCQSEDYVKSGHVRGLQRFRCKDCGCQFTDTKARGESPLLKQLSIVLYAHHGVSMGGIARLFKVSTVAVLKWIRKAAEKIEQAQQTEETMSAEQVQVDEMWHFVNGKKTKFGCGGRWMGYHAVLSPGNSVIVLTKV